MSNKARPLQHLHSRGERPQLQYSGSICSKALMPAKALGGGGAERHAGTVGVGSTHPAARTRDTAAAECNMSVPGTHPEAAGLCQYHRSSVFARGQRLPMDPTTRLYTDGHNDFLEPDSTPDSEGISDR
jgi:hypothetical protein